MKIKVLREFARDVLFPRRQRHCPVCRGGRCMGACGVLSRPAGAEDKKSLSGAADERPCSPSRE